MKFNNIIYTLYCGGISLVLTGCAGVTTKAITTGNDVCGIWSDQPCGIRHYGYKVPFILLTPRTDGGVDSALIYLPDTTKLYSTRPYAFIAANNTKLYFSKGVMEYSKSVIDETKLPTVAMQILAALAEKATKAFMPLSTEINAPVQTQFDLTTPALFRVFVNDQNVLVARGKYNGNDIIVDLTTATVTPTQNNQQAGGK
ncbi:hypothetical protein A1359_20330 [Methylomonas lenta]|uniref:Lipoprotein n=1 Tax=Methylomonas lenta TaxID=980561 RepID=A0A177NRX7_9GAMM|nr:hypothetical protein [Methylomonas lenta]OAI20837.1 hypothetical protein A1359_20330 [Methylomonas lenta]